MASRITRSWLLAAFALLWAALFAGLALLGLNDRFLDSAPLGWLILAGGPLAASIPTGLLFFALSFVPPAGGAAHAGRSLGVAVALFLLPPSILLLYTPAARLLEGSGVLLYALLLLPSLAIAVGSYRIGRLAARKVAPAGTPFVAACLPPAILLLLLPAVGSWLSRQPIHFDERPRTLMLCVDGATWDLVDRMIADGKLPTFRSLLEEGTRFEMQSARPLMSPILWTSIASGVGPDEHGVKNFYTSASDVTAPRLWDMVEAMGGDVGVFGWPVTWPPRPVRGFLIPSLFARGPETYPENLGFIRELAMMEKGKRKREPARYALFAVRLAQYGMRLSTFVEAARVLSRKGDFLEEMSARRFLKLRIHSDLFVELWERYQPDFAAFYNNGIDVTCHYFWKYFEPESFADVTADEAARYGAMIPDMYAAADRALGKILRYAPNGIRLVVVSDHGLQATQTEEAGTIRLIRTERFLERLGIAGAVNGVNLASRVHLSAKRGRGFPPGLSGMIESVVLEGSGEPVFLTQADASGSIIVHVRRDVDLAGERLRIPGREGCPVDEVIEETFAKISGEHNRSAILLFKGKGVRRGVSAGEASIYDVAPTTLYLMGLPAGEAMPGDVLAPAFTREHLGAHPRTRTVYDLPENAGVPAAGDAGEEVLKEQLKALGYLN